MNEKIEFFEAPLLYCVAAITINLLVAVISIEFIMFPQPEDPWYWVGMISVYSTTIMCNIILLVSTMGKVRLTSQGITKSLLNRFRKQELLWENIKDCRLATTANGYCYIIVSDQPIKTTRISESLKDKKHCICWAYNKDSLEYINEHMQTTLESIHQDNHTS